MKISKQARVVTLKTDKTAVSLQKKMECYFSFEKLNKI